MTRRKVILPYWAPSKEDVSNKEALKNKFGDLSQGELIINNSTEGSYLTILDSNDNPSTFDSSKVSDTKISESFESATTFAVSAITETKSELTDAISEAKDELTSAITETKSELTVAISEAKEELTSAITETKDDMPIVKGDAENSAVLKGEHEGYSNKAISQVSTAIGAASTSGLKGWYYTHVNIDEKKIFLGTERTKIAGIDTLTCTYKMLIVDYSDSKYTDSSFVSGYEVGDVLSIVYDSKYEDYATITAISGNVITLDNIPFVADDFTAGACTKVSAVGQPDEFSVYCIKRDFNDTTKVLTLSKYDKGGVDFGGGALSEGVQTYSVNIGAHAEGGQTVAKGQYSHAEGIRTQANYAAHAEGINSIAYGYGSHAEGSGSMANGEGSHAEGYKTQAIGKYSHTEGRESVAAGVNSHAEGQASYANKNNSHAEGQKTIADGDASHSEGRETIASGNYSHAEGRETTASNNNAHAEGQGTVASGHTSHAEGWKCIAGTSDTAPTANSNEDAGNYAHAEGNGTWAKGNSSHSEGRGTKAFGLASHSEGQGTISNNRGEHAEGLWNKSNKSTIHSVGIGTSDTDRKNAHEITTDGKHYIFGVGNYTGITLDDATDVATVINNKAEKTDIVTPDWNANQYQDGYIKNRTHYLDCDSYTPIDVESEEDYDTGMMRHTYRFVASSLSEETKVAVKVEIYNPTDGGADYIKYVILNTNDYISGEGEDIISFKVGFTEFYGTQDGDEITLWTLIGTTDEIPNLSYADIYDRQYKQLDEVFISSDIARKSDVEKVDFYLGEVEGQASYAVEMVEKLEEQLTELSAQVGKKVDADWSASEGEEGFIKNRTHYATQIPLSTIVDTFIEDFPKHYDGDTERYYSKQDVDILYTEDEYDFLLTIPANTLLGYDYKSDVVTIEIDSEGEIFQFESHSEMGDIFIKVTKQNSGNNFRVVLYNQLDEKYIPDTIARKDDLSSLQLGITSEKLHLLGVVDKEAATSDTLYTSYTDVYIEDGELFALSDETYKVFGEKVEVDFEKLKTIPKVYYTWKDGSDDKPQIGTSAQKLREIYPEAVSEVDGKLAVSYHKLSIIALAAIDELHKENEELKARLKAIEDKLGL